MTLEDQEKQVLIAPEIVQTKTSDPRMDRKKEPKNAEVFEQKCLIPDLHPMKNLPALSDNDEAKI